MTSAILQTFPLGTQWQTLDPFLFCAHHLDLYPESNGSLGPKPALTGRTIGQDFAGVDGWNMYHGATVPGFPQHPHRGFETVTYVRRGWCDHSDSLGAQARFGEGDVQWVTAGAGIVHSEMFPLFDQSGPNTLHLFQIWLNLPAADKMVDPHFTMLWNRDIPKHREEGVEVTVIAGSLGATGPDQKVAPSPPPNSWASTADSDVAIWHLRLDANARWDMPQATADANRILYLFAGAAEIDGKTITENTGVVLDPAATVAITTSGGADGAEAMVLQGKPIGEPVAQYGPFVLNDEAGIRQAMSDYQRTQFGGWPWPSDDPVHGDTPVRFARHADGRVEELTN